MKNKIIHTVCVAFLVIIAAFALGTICYIHFLLPAPEYEVSTYQELSAALKKNPELVIPTEDCLPSEPTYLTVYVPHRLRSSAKAGYEMVMVAENATLCVNCRTLDSYSKAGQEIPEFLANQHFGEMPVMVTDYQTTISVIFHTDTCRYSVTANSQNGILTQETKNITAELAQSLINQVLP